MILETLGTILMVFVAVIIGLALLGLAGYWAIVIGYEVCIFVCEIIWMAWYTLWMVWYTLTISFYFIKGFIEGPRGVEK